MIKMFAFIPRRADLTEEYFHGHWGHYHSTLAVQIRVLRRYVQAHRLEPAVPGLPATPYDGIAECWLERLEEALEFGENPDFTEVAQRDDPNFVDLENLTAVICAMPRLLWSERDLGRTSASVKLALCLRADGEVGGKRFRADLPERCGAARDLLPGAWRATLALTEESAYDLDTRPAYDAVLELWFDDFEAYRAAWAASGEALLGGLDAIVDRDRSAGFPAEEWRFIWPLRPLSGA